MVVGHLDLNQFRNEINFTARCNPHKSGRLSFLAVYSQRLQSDVGVAAREVDKVISPAGAFERRPYIQRGTLAGFPGLRTDFALAYEGAEMHRNGVVTSKREIKNKM